MSGVDIGCTKLACWGGGGGGGWGYAELFGILDLDVRMFSSGSVSSVQLLAFVMVCIAPLCAQ